MSFMKWLIPSTKALPFPWTPIWDWYFLFVSLKEWQSCVQSNINIWKNQGIELVEVKWRKACCFCCLQTPKEQPNQVIVLRAGVNIFLFAPRDLGKNFEKYRGFLEGFMVVKVLLGQNFRVVKVVKTWLFLMGPLAGIEEGEGGLVFRLTLILGGMISKSEGRSCYHGKIFTLKGKIITMFCKGNTAGLVFSELSLETRGQQKC